MARDNGGEGLDPQDLYAQNHARSKRLEWGWDHGAVTPDQAYCEKFYNRTADLINRYHPDLIYFDDTVLPLWSVSDAGLKIAAHFYNSNTAWHNGDLRAVLFGKILNEEQRKAITWDIERGVPATSLPFAWQTDTCIGGWHYDRGTYDHNRYKTAKNVIQMLADIVSKNGNLLLNIPVRSDGTIDEKEVKVLEGIAAWMDVNKEAIFDTRPWTIFGEGPASAGTPISAQGFNEGKGKPFTWQDVRFTAKGDALYAIVLDNPGKKDVVLHFLTETAGLKVKAVSRLGYTGKLEWKQDKQGLTVTMPVVKPDDSVVVLKVL